MHVLRHVVLLGLLTNDEAVGGLEGAVVVCPRELDRLTGEPS